MGTQSRIVLSRFADPDPKLFDQVWCLSSQIWPLVSFHYEIGMHFSHDFHALQCCKSKEIVCPSGCGAYCLEVRKGNSHSLSSKVRRSAIPLSVTNTSKSMNIFVTPMPIWILPTAPSLFRTKHGLKNIVTSSFFGIGTLFIPRKPRKASSWMRYHRPTVHLAHLYIIRSRSI